MKKSTKYAKKLLALFLVVLMSIDSFAAVVSDNDGAAFITKAEFDSLKNDFQAELNIINSGIDNKIDGASNAYLTGIKQTKTEVRYKLIESNTWKMWTSTDYPTYTEGKPYVHGTCGMGNGYGETYTSPTVNVFWTNLAFEGKAAYKLNGGFKKHFLVNPKQYKNGFNSNIYGGQYNGYWINEGEDIVIGGWEAVSATNYGAIGSEYGLFPYDDNLFENLDLSLQGDVIFSNLELTKYVGGAGWTGTKLSAQTATRLVGQQNEGTNICTYDAISDNRFYDTDGNNKIGISDSTPAILKNDTYPTYKTWFNDVVGTHKISYAIVYLQNYSSGKWREQDWLGAWSYTGGGMLSGIYNGSKDNRNKSASYIKMANIPYNIQFHNVWSPLTDSVAVTLYSYLSKTGVTIPSGMTDRIKYALIMDGTTPHLSLKAGYPLVEVKKGEEVEWNVKAGTKPLNIVAKYGPFQMGTVSPQSDADVNFYDTDTTTTRVIVAPANTESRIRFKAEYDGVIFFKWATTDGKSAELDVSKNPKVTLVNGG